MPPEGDQADLAGYPSVEALASGYRASSAEAKKWRDHAQQLEQQQREPAPEPERQPVRQRSNSPYDRIAEYGVPAEEIRRAIKMEIDEAFMPIAQGLKARGEMTARYPDYNKFESDVAMFVGADPQLNQTYQKLFAADPLGAMEYAVLKFTDSRKGESSKRRAEPDRSRAAEAAIPSSRAGDSRNAGGDTREAVRAGWENFQKTGNAVPFAKARLKEAVSDDFLNRG